MEGVWLLCVKSVRARASHKWHMPSLRPLSSLCQNQRSLRDRCMIGFSQRKLSPHLGPPHLQVSETGEYGFGEHGFKHRAQWVFWPSPRSGERTQWVPLSLLFVCQSELNEFFAELTEFTVKLSEAQWVLVSKTVLSKQYSARFLKCLIYHLHPPRSVNLLCLQGSPCRMRSKRSPTRRQ